MLMISRLQSTAAELQRPATMNIACCLLFAHSIGILEHLGNTSSNQEHLDSTPGVNRSLATMTHLQTITVLQLSAEMQACSLAYD